MRRVAWFSCGAASACAAKLAIDEHGRDVEVVYCDLSRDEHEDNKRFLVDVERWIGKKITVIGSTKFTSVEEVWNRRQYMSGPSGAPCTIEMKKIPRFEFQRVDDINIFGFTADEIQRMNNFISRNPELYLEWPLIDAQITKQDCYQILRDAGIDLPAMYLLGFHNNNCLGCVKATSPGYWNKIRKHFPEVFARRAKQSRDIGCKLVQVHKQRIFLDELDPSIGRFVDEHISCGVDCAAPTIGSDGHQDK